MQTLGREQRSAAIASAKLNIAYFSYFTRCYVADYKIGFKPEIVDNGEQYAVMVHFDKRKIEISEKEYDRAANSRYLSRQFPDISVEYIMSSIIARRYIANLDITPQEALKMMKKGEIRADGETYAIRYLENEAKADAMLKLIPMLSLYEGSERKDWRKFADRQMSAILTSDISWLVTVESENELTHKRVGDETKRAREEYEKTGGFREFTLRFHDSLYKRTRDPDTQQELLSDIFALVFLQTHPKRSQLEKLISDFFDEQYVKQQALSLSVMLRKPLQMQAQKTEHDEFLDKIRSGMRKSRTMPRLATDLAKEWSEN